MFFRLLTKITTSRPSFTVIFMALLSVVALSQSAGLSSRLSTQGFQNNGAQSTAALDQLDKATKADMRAQVVALVEPGKQVDSPSGRKLVAKVTKKLEDDKDIKLVKSPFDDDKVDHSLIAKDGKSAIVVANLRRGRAEGGLPDRLSEQFADIEHVRLGGWQMTQHKVSATIEHDLRRAEMIAFPLIFLIALFVFRGLIAAFLPVLVGAITIPVTFALLRAFDGITDLSVFALNLTTGMGLGLAIDYSLLMVTRYREELAAGADTAEAVRNTIATAGRTVAYSAITVAGATAALCVFPLKFLYSMGIGGATVALVSAAVALVLLPALLLLLGKHIDRFALPRRSAEYSIALWHRLATFVMRRPLPVAVATAALLIVLTLPVLGIKFTSVDATVLQRGADARVVQQTVDDTYPRNDANTSLWVAVASSRYDAVQVGRDARRVARQAKDLRKDSAKLKRDAKKLQIAMLTPGADPAKLRRENQRIDDRRKSIKRRADKVDRRADRVQRSVDRLDAYEDRLKSYAKRIERIDGVEQTGKLKVVGDNTWKINIYTKGARYSQETQQVVSDVRALKSPGERWVGGVSASYVDQRDAITSRFGLSLALIGIITFLALFLMTGSVVLPIKTFIMNLLTLGATFGILVLIFQDNRLEGLLGYEGQSALEMTQPVLLFAIAFGLTTDYGVFLLSRIKEFYDAGGSNKEAVADGVAHTGRVISSAAVLFCVAIASFSTSGIVFVKELGIGTGLAVAIDATIVRALLVPAVMAMLGRFNWWAPKPMRWLHDRIGLSEGPSVPAVASTGAGPVDGRDFGAAPVRLVAPVHPHAPAPAHVNVNGNGNGNGTSFERPSVPPPVVAPLAPAAVAPLMAVSEAPEPAPRTAPDSGHGSAEIGPAVAGADAVGDAVPSGAADRVGDVPVVDHGEQRVYNLRIELGPGVADHLGPRLLESDRLSVGPVGDHRVERVADQYDSAREWDRFARKAIWVAVAVPALMFVADRLRNR
ncbi:MAG: MMPL family transporter [Actinobacteria bacterium]|nr:MMPL family transporter [Actinomycetota bacterium]